MRELLNRRPDRPLPSAQHERMRADLLAELDSESVRTPRRTLVPVAAAAAVLLVAAGLAVAVPALQKDDAGTPVAGAGQPVVRDLSAADTTALEQQCLAEADRITVKQLPRPFRSYQPVRAFEFVDVKDPKVVKTWLIAKGRADVWQDGVPPIIDPATEPDGYWLCSRTAGGAISESSIRQPGGDLPSEVRRVARNAGVFAGSVQRVTMQPTGQPERDAYLYDGFWFAPTVGRVGWGLYDADDPDLSDFVYRAYDGAGREVYSSANPPKPPPCAHPVWRIAANGTKTPAGPADPTLPPCPTYKWPS